MKREQSWDRWDCCRLRAWGTVQGCSSLSTVLHPVLRRVYAARGIEHDQDLDLGLAHLLPVTTLGGLPAAVELLISCHTRRSRVVVVGDFDADGATSTALVVRQLRRLGFEDPGYEMVVHTAPNVRSRILLGEWATIRDDYHWHIEVVARPEAANRIGGIFVTETPPEETALKLREALGGDAGL